MAFGLMQGNKCAMTDESLWGEHYVLKDVNRFATTEHFWDCECETNYIHPKSVPVCPRCGAVSDECSDSRINEVFAALMASPDISNW